MSEFGLTLDRYGIGTPSVNRSDRSANNLNSGGEKIEAGQKSFSSLLEETLSNVNKIQLEADKATQDFASGQNVQLHEVMIAMEKADVALRTVTAFRNKFVEAYQEIMRMPV